SRMAGFLINNPTMPHMAFPFTARLSTFQSQKYTDWMYKNRANIYALNKTYLNGTNREYH
ncbi:hypothetical protein ABTA56_19595, partial [Acinetobacter baumannii]